MCVPASSRVVPVNNKESGATKLSLVSKPDPEQGNHEHNSVYTALSRAIWISKIVAMEIGGMLGRGYK